MKGFNIFLKKEPEEAEATEEVTRAVPEPDTEDTHVPTLEFGSEEEKEPVHEPELTLEPQAEPVAETETAAETEASAEPEVEAAPAAEPAPEPKVEPKTETVAEPAAEPAAETKEEKKERKRKARKKKLLIAKIILAIILILFLVYAAFMYVVPAFNRAEGTKVSGSADWMSGLGDRARISIVAIPGTHDSAARNVGLAYFSKCQSFTIERQLESGYRYLDIRLAVDEGRLKLMHGFVDCKAGGAPWSDTLYLEEVLEQCYTFLEEHPTEFIVFAVKQEHGRESVNEFERLLMSYITQEPEKWLLTDNIPTVGESRGKLVLMRRFEDEAGLGTGSGIPLIWEDQGNRKETYQHIVEEENGRYTLWVQDRYKYDPNDKWNAFTEGLKNGKADTTDISIHFLSTNGNTTFGHPYKYAKDLNARFMELDQKFTGWIIMDFASAPMAEHVYSSNFSN